MHSHRQLLKSIAAKAKVAEAQKAVTDAQAALDAAQAKTILI